MLSQSFLYLINQVVLPDGRESAALEEAARPQDILPRRALDNHESGPVRNGHSEQSVQDRFNQQ